MSRTAVSRTMRSPKPDDQLIKGVEQVLSAKEIARRPGVAVSEGRSRIRFAYFAMRRARHSERLQKVGSGAPRC
jgi:hypothetical protein